MLKYSLFLAVCQVFFLYSAIYAQDNIAVNKKSPKILYGTASFYAAKFKGRLTANGETFNHDNLTAACNVLPLGTWIRVTNLRNRRTVLLKVNDRLHPKTKRVVDLTHFGAQKLNFIKSGLTRVKVEVLGRKKPAN